MKAQRFTLLVDNDDLTLFRDALKDSSKELTLSGFIREAAREKANGIIAKRPPIKPVDNRFIRR